MPLEQLKQIIQIKHNIVKNPNWPEADQLAIYKCGRGFELGRSVKQIQLVARAGLEPGTAGLRVRRADHSATLPPTSSSSLLAFFRIKRFVVMPVPISGLPIGLLTVKCLKSLHCSYL